MVDFRRVENLIIEDVEAHQDFIDAAKTFIAIIVQWVAAGMNSGYKDTVVYKDQVRKDGF